MTKLDNFSRKSKALGAFTTGAGIFSASGALAQETSVETYSRDVLFEVKSDYILKAGSSIAELETDGDPVGLRQSQYLMRDGKLFVNAEGAQALVPLGVDVDGWELLPSGALSTNSAGADGAWPAWLAGVAPSTWAIGFGGAALAGGMGVLGYSLLNQSSGDDGAGAGDGDGDGDGDGGGDGFTPSTSPVFSNSGQASVLENTVGNVMLIEATDDNDTSLSFTLSGEDADKFKLLSSGELQIDSGVALDFENPADTNADNDYQVTVTATDDDGNTTEQAISIIVENVDELPPVFAGGDQLNATSLENTTETSVDELSVDDPDASTLKYSISGGADATLFEINSATGKLSWVQARDLEDQSSADGDDTYEVEIMVTDGGGFTDTTLVTVLMLNVDEPTVLSDTAAFVDSVSELDHEWSHQNVATDPDGGTPTYELTGEHASMFEVSNLGVVVWKDGVAPDYEVVRGGPFQLTLVSRDPSDGSTSSQEIEITLTDVDDADPEYSAASTTGSALENQTTIDFDNPSDFSVLDDDSDLDTLRYSITGGDDQALFTVDNVTGVVHFTDAPNNERPLDANLDNIYEVQLQVIDLGGQTDTIDVSVSISDDAAPDDYDISPLPSFTWDLTRAFNNIDPRIDAVSGADRLDDFKAAGIYVVHESVFGEEGDDEDLMVVFWDETGTSSNSDPGYMYLFYDTWGDVLTDNYTSYMTDSNDKFDAPMTATAYFDEAEADYFTARVFDIDNLHDSTIDYEPSEVEGTNTGTQTGLGFYEGTDGASGYGEYFQLTTTQLMRADSDNILEGITISSLFGYNPNHMYEAADIDADGDVDFFEYNPVDDTLNFFERTSDSGFNQLTLATGQDNPFEGLSIKQLANGGLGETALETVSSIAFYNLDSDADLELIVSGQTNAYIYDFT